MHRLAAILVALLTAGCAMPSGMTGLHAILEDAGLEPGPVRDYRCTGGAHRGNSRVYLENTLKALQAAEADASYRFIEFDVQYTADGRIVAHHDKRLLRGFGKLSAIGDSTFAELTDLTGGEIASFDVIMDTLAKPLNIEIKSRGDLAEDRRLVDEVLADIRRRNRGKDVMLSSISDDVIRYINERYPDVPTGQIFWFTSSTYLHLDAFTRGLYEKIRNTGADYLMLHIANLRNIADLIHYKPRDKTLVFWAFDDRMYIVHQDFHDRLWGDSSADAVWQGLRYRLSFGRQRNRAARRSQEGEVGSESR